MCIHGFGGENRRKGSTWKTPAKMEGFSGSGMWGHGLDLAGSG